jgi:hypothetical protein
MWTRAVALIVLFGVVLPLAFLLGYHAGMAWVLP